MSLMLLLAKQTIFSRNVAALIMYIYGNGYQCTMGDAYRTPQQAMLYTQVGKGIVGSLHCKRLAIDLDLFKEHKYFTDTQDYQQFGQYWESLHPLNRWGGQFKHRPDGNHFEMQDI